MKRILLMAAALLCLTGVAKAQNFETATEAIANMGVGWNLGNTLDATSGKSQDLTSEIYWGQPYTTPELMVMMKEAGIGAIRVPVTWYNHMDTSGKVDAAWMSRVKEVVDYVISQGLYCIVNVHHDTGDGTQWLHATSATYSSTRNKYESLWKQIAETFKDYDQRLLFEGYNEMLDKYNSWCYATYNTSSRYIAADAKDAYDAINNYAQSFVNAVRSTGGNNAKRNLVVNTYGACCGSGTWNTHLKDPLTEMKLPTDVAGTGHIIFQVHSYPAIATESGGVVTNRSMTAIKAEIDDMVTALKTNLVAKGAPVIIGEWGTSNVDSKVTDYDGRRSHMMAFVDYFIKTMKANGIGTFCWMGLSSGAYRSMPAFDQPDLAQQIVKSYYGSCDAYVYPTKEDFDIDYTVAYEKQWGEAYLYTGSALSLSEYKGVTVEMIEATPTGSLSVKTYGEGDKTQSAGLSSALTTTVTFSASQLGSSITAITLQNMLSTANTAKVRRVTLLKKDGTTVETVPSAFWGCTVTTHSAKKSSGIQGVAMQRPISDVTFDLSGHRVIVPKKGIVIRNGKKYVAR